MKLQAFRREGVRGRTRHAAASADVSIEPYDSLYLPVESSPRRAYTEPFA
jgi:hypothetical protein